MQFSGLWNLVQRLSSSNRPVATSRRRRQAYGASTLTSAVESLEQRQLLTAGLDSLGTDFWLTFTENYDRQNTLTLFISGATATEGTVEIPGLQFTHDFTVTPGAVTSVSIPIGALLQGNDSIENKGIHVTAEADVAVYGLNRQQYTTDAYLGIPTDILGKDYLVLTTTAYSKPQFGIVATVDNTTVTITPKVTNLGATRTAGQAFTITLNAGQTYQFQANNNTDLTGTSISANHPVAVFSGDNLAFLPSISYGSGDHTIEQLPPVSAWGKNYLSVPLATRLNGDTFRIVASANNTVVQVNGTIVATLQRGQVHQQIIAGAAQITANEPILVAQYSNGSIYDGVTSDPFMMLIAPYEQYLGSYTVTTPASGFTTNFINVVAPQDAIGHLTLDGQTIASESFTAIGSTGFYAAQLPVSLGSHVLADSRPAGQGAPFGVTVYGFADYDSYGYPGGFSLSPIAQVKTVDLTSSHNPVNVGYSQKLTATVTDQQGNPLEGIRVDFVVEGANANSGFGYSDATGKVDFWYIGYNLGEDVASATVGNLSDEMTYDVVDPTVTLSMDYSMITVAPKTTVVVDDNVQLTVANPKANYTMAVLQVSMYYGDAKDVLGILKEKGKSAPVTLKGKNVLYNGTVVGTVSGGNKKQPMLEVAFNSSATREAVLEVMRRVTFTTKNKTLPQQSRILKMQVLQIGGNASNLAMRTINVDGVGR